jgi:hypothetical protein
MSIKNYMPHSFDVFTKSQFINLEQTNPTTWIADGVEGNAIVSVPSQGSVRMSTSTQELGVDSNGVPVYNTVYGELTGFPTELEEGDVVLVSLPVVSMMKASGHPLSAFVASPYNAVRLRSNTSTVLGCMGYTH